MCKNWYVLYVKPQNEKKVADSLRNADIEVYCPMIKEVKVWSDRKKTIETPLFKSYVFVRLLEKERSLVFNFHGVLRYLFWLGKPAIVRDEEIDVIKHWLSNDIVEEYSLATLMPGDRISIKNNLLGNREAIIKEVGKRRVKLIFEGLGMILNMKLKQLV